VIADRVGRALVTIVAMAISATCALVIGPLIGAPLFVVGAVALVWGISIVADSAQFSASVTELAPSRYVGTAITLQTCLGFLLTIVTIRLVPVWANTWGWERAYMPLAIGPVLGIVAMWPLWRSARTSTR
jgi:sugar phosphate permease